MQWFPFTRRIARQWVDHDNTRSAAAIAYYAIFTLAPTLVVATAVAGQFVGRDDARQMIEERLAQAVGPAGAQVADDVLSNSRFFRHGLTATIISSVLLLYGASAMFYQVRSALDRVFECRQHACRRDALISAVVGRLLAALFVLGTGGLLVVMLLANVVMYALDEWLAENVGLHGMGWHATGELASVAVTAIVFLAILKLLPAERPPLRYVLPGATVAVVLFEVGKWLIGLYISHSIIASAYGPSSSIVALILWIYCSTLILLFGAEVSKLLMDGRKLWGGTSAT